MWFLKNEKTMKNLALLLSRESQLITAQDCPAPMFALYATLMLAIRCSHYSSMCRNAMRKEIWATMKSYPIT